MANMTGTRQTAAQLVDYHVHLEGDLDLARALELSSARDVRLGIVEHAGSGQVLYDDASLLAWVDRCSHTPFLCGIQAEGRDWMNMFSAKVVSRLDYVLTDALTFPDPNGDLQRLWEPGVRIADAQDFMDRYVQFHLDIIANEPIDIMANCTFLPWCLATQYDSLWTMDRVEELVQALATHGVALEINSRYRIPTQPIIARARAAGLRFAMGSNYHNENVGHLEYCVQAVRECGLQDTDFFVPGSNRNRPSLGDAR